MADAPPSRLALMLLVLVNLLVPVATALQSPSPTDQAYALLRSDGLQFRAVAEVLLDGGDPYDVAWTRPALAAHLGQDPPVDLQFAYPPNSLPFFAGYGLGTPRQGFVFMVTVSSALCLLAALAWARPPTLADAVFWVVGLSFGGAMWFNASLGQTGTWAAAGVFGVAATLGRRPVAAGVWLGLLAVKPQYAVPLAVFAWVRGERRTVVVSAVTFLSLSALSALWFGPDLWPAWVTETGRHNLTLGGMATWRSLSTALQTPALDGPAVLLWAAVAVAVPWLTRHRAPEDALALLVAVVCLASPNTHPYDLLLWTLPAAALFRRLGQRPALGAVVAGMFVYVPIVAFARWMFPVVGLLAVLALLRPEGESS